MQVKTPKIMKKDDDELEGMEQQEPAEDNTPNDVTPPENDGGDGGNDGGEPQAHSTYQVPKDKKLQLRTGFSTMPLM